jgi:transposase
VKSLAQRCLQLDAETKALDIQIDHLSADACPALRQVYGVGPDTAATLLVALGDNPHRITSDTAFAKLCGVAPVEPSSDKTVRHRLNRGGNRDATRAMHHLSRTDVPPPTHSRLPRPPRRRRQDQPQIMRCIKT